MGNIFMLFLCILPQTSLASDTKQQGSAKSVAVPSAVAIIDNRAKQIKASGVLLTPNRVFASCHAIVSPKNNTQPRPTDMDKVDWRATVGNIGLGTTPTKYSSKIIQLVVAEECYLWEKHPLNVDIAVLWLETPFELQPGKVEVAEVATHIRDEVYSKWKSLIKGNTPCVEIGYAPQPGGLIYTKMAAKKLSFCSELNNMPLGSFEEYLSTHSLGCAEIVTEGGKKPVNSEAGGPVVCQKAFYGMSHGQMSLEATRSYTTVTQLEYYLPFITKMIDPMKNLGCEVLGKGPGTGSNARSKPKIQMASKSNHVTGAPTAFLGVVLANKLIPQINLP